MQKLLYWGLRLLSRNAGPPGIITYAVLFVIALGANVSLWTAAIRRGSIGVGEIDTYLKQPRTSYRTAVDRFWDYLVSTGDLDEELDAEAKGEDVEEKRNKRALGKLKRWRRHWKKLPEPKKRAGIS